MPGSLPKPWTRRGEAPEKSRRRVLDMHGPVYARLGNLVGTCYARLTDIRLASTQFSLRGKLLARRALEQHSSLWEPTDMS